MKLRLIRAARILHQAGETVEVSPAEAGFLLSTKSAEIVPDVKETPETETAKKTTRKKK